MEAILHVLGLCGDNQSHLDLLDILFGTGFASGALYTLKYYWLTINYIIKEKIINIKMYLTNGGKKW